MQQPLLLKGEFYFCAHEVAASCGIDPGTAGNWLRARATSYDFELKVEIFQGRRLLAERDLRIIERVQRDWPVIQGGPGPRDRREKMREYAYRLRAAATANV